MVGGLEGGMMLGWINSLNLVETYLGFIIILIIWVVASYPAETIRETKRDR